MIWSGLKELNELAKKICDDFAADYPPSMQGEAKPQAKRKLAAALVSVDQNISRFLAASPRLGVFNKAKCANEVKWGLKDMGFREELVDTVTHKIVHGLSRVAAKSKVKAKSGSS